MKKIMTAVFAVCLTLAVSAQRGHGPVRSRIIVVSPSFGYGYSAFGYSPFGYSPFGYSRFGYPYDFNNSYNRPSKLDMKVSDIKADYNDKIKSAKKDSNISKDERKKIVSQLKADRDKAVHNLKANYYKQKTTPVETGSDGKS